MLSVESVTVQIDSKVIISDVSLTVHDQETMAVLGPSGSGKSTLLRAIAGLVEVTAGDITWDGVSVVDVPTHLREFGLMFQGYALFPHLSVEENIAFGLRMRGETEVRSHVDEALEWVGLSGFGPRAVDGLSGGEQQRVALARTLAARPRLVMLDEPLGALDRELRRRLLEEIHEILEARRVTGIVVTHDRDEAAMLSDRLALMRDGRIVQTGTLDEMLAGPADEWVRSFLS
jgi:ABC-type Fe3+/spermidine/putrescine transport system ATPase subunit